MWDHLGQRPWDTGSMGWSCRDRGPWKLHVCLWALVTQGLALPELRSPAPEEMGPVQLSGNTWRRVCAVKPDQLPSNLGARGMIGRAPQSGRADSLPWCPPAAHLPSWDCPGPSRGLCPSGSLSSPPAAPCSLAAIVPAWPSPVPGSRPPVCACWALPGRALVLIMRHGVGGVRWCEP